MSFTPPVNDILATLKSISGLPEMIERGLFNDLDMDTVEAILVEAGRFSSEVLAPLNDVGDRESCKLTAGSVSTPKGWQAAYNDFREAGWNSLPGPQAYGGQALPSALSMAVCELWNGANLSFGLCPLLTQGAIDALHAHGSDELKSVYLEKMISGEWTGTMNLTEPQAGSDLGAITTRAEAAGDGSYLIKGTKIFITYGEHDLTENIIHMVLARLPDAPPGTRGISLFLVPKFLVNADGSLGERNDLACTGIEHKLGIHASPTCTMSYGEKAGATGYLVGEPHRGLVTMFIMMNAARLAVGIQGVGIAERATQLALAYAQERKQGRVAHIPDDGMHAIVHHPDVRRQLMMMKSLTAAARAICLATAGATDLSHRASDPDQREAAANRVALLTPIAKAFSTDIGCEVASLGVQIHGGMGFIEETGAAQFYRDARILPIYEGTNGIQALDLVNRKLTLDNGGAVEAYLDELTTLLNTVSLEDDGELVAIAKTLKPALQSLRTATEWLKTKLAEDRSLAQAGATPYLRAFGLTAGGIYLAAMARASVHEGSSNQDAVIMANFYADNLASGVPGLVQSVTEGSALISADLAWLEAGA